jgi:hypothetical protein
MLTSGRFFPARALLVQMNSRGPNLMDTISIIVTAYLSSTRGDDVQGMPEPPKVPLIRLKSPHAPTRWQCLICSISGMIMAPVIG